MRKFFVLLDRELRSYFLSPLGYIILCFTLALGGLHLFIITSLSNNHPQASMLAEYYFNGVFFWLSYMSIVPLLTMRLYSEEFKMGTIETLSTAPVRDWQIILSKFAGALMFYVMLWLAFGLYLFIYAAGTGQPVVQSSGAFASTYLLLLVMGCFYLSVGCLASVLTQNQVIAAIVAAACNFGFFFFGLFLRAWPNLDPRLREVPEYLSSYEHLVRFSSGIIDTRQIVFYLSLAVLLQVATFQVFQYRKWKA